ncbi:VWA domain-containing protein [Bifidobacterium pullorum]|uniref:VWA domain-containing protein n=1 Tax=Bifidobacterium pullorum TaxID=78448 RepID=UPI003208B18C
MHWDWNPLNDVSYLKAEGGSSLEGEIGVEGTASLTWSDSVKIGKLEQGKTFMVGIVPVYVSAQADITLEPSIKVAGKISWTKNVKVEAQAGARHQGDGNIKLKGYANVRGNESKDTTCPNAGFSGELSLTPEIGIAVAPKLKLYDAIGPGIKLTPAIGGKISGKGDDSGTFTGSSELYAQVSAQVTFDLTIPVIDTELAHWESDKLTAKYTISADKDMTIPACKPDDGSTGGGSGEGSGGGTAWDTVGNVTVTWKDPTSGKTASYTVKSGTQFSVDQAQLESKLGLGAGALDGMKGVATGEKGTGKVYRTGTVFQTTSDTTLYVFYNDPELPEIDNTDTNIVFVIDSTGSMGGEIGAVKEYVSNLADAIGGVSASYRMALVDYKDDCDSYQSRVDVDFTSDVPTFKEGVSNLYADGGGDAAESVYSGLNTALDLDWRDGVRRSIFIIGDAPGKDPEPVTGFTQSDIVDKAIAEGVGIYPLGRVSSYGRARSMPAMPESNGNDQNNDQQNDAAPDAAPSKDESGTVSEPAAALLSDTLLSPVEATSGNAVVRTIADTRAVDTSSFEGFTSGLADATGGVYTEYTSEDFIEKLLQIVVSATVTVRTQSGISGRGSHTIVVTDRVPTTTFSGTVTLASGRTPTFTLPVLPGTEAYGTLTFDTGEQTKTVPGEGTWSISMDGNLITAVFTPEEGYTGSAPTPQTYLLSDAFGDTVNGRLTVVYK